MLIVDLQLLPIRILNNRDKVQLNGFGNFEVRERAARKERNPQTGEEIESKMKKYQHLIPKAFKG
ncbi:HU family DNA-binding protein [Bacillus sp. FJAT-29953]|uniref:HU family DNA-binding protein n=1 Tax=Neobacillus rhizophilus TaxID=2833579 RepID=A0A942YX56_9BACI|nr:HU family DNA-binding protein [Neobacillus rhizophilus]MBU8918624.1 HU family DNA-binding protein [Bacillus sp. FJAT-29953]